MHKCEVINIADVQKTYANVLGVVLLLVGVVGFFNNPILGLFGVNTAQNLLHLVGGVLGLWLGGKNFNKWTGLLALLVGVLWFLPVTGDLLASLFGINTEISVLHLLIGVVSLGVTYGVKE